jgi:hypothetical protein
MSKRMKNKQSKIDLKLKCGACGGKGHMRTNKACPKFVPDEFDESLNVSFTDKDEVFLLFFFFFFLGPPQVPRSGSQMPLRKKRKDFFTKE